ncbi:MAG: hypothetical protein IGR92_02935 [Leptolyngbyaceae cyanobacterium T60_A2020_046]|nr:hypothetical protein [Leptolyngbyaceae cyanobacterium T60_A2020_046]
MVQGTGKVGGAESVEPAIACSEPAHPGTGHRLPECGTGVAAIAALTRVTSAWRTGNGQR